MHKGRRMMLGALLYDMEGGQTDNFELQLEVLLGFVGS
jgi:hypothetical protein